MPLGGIMSAVGIGGSILSGILGGRPQTTTSTPIFSSGQQQLQGNLFNTLSSQLANPTDYLTPQKNAALGNVNATYNGLENSTQASLARRGFGASGKVGTNIQQIQLGRAGAQAGVESSFAGLAQNQSNFDLSSAMQAAFADPGSKTTGPSNMAGAGISGGLSTASFLYALNHFMSGGGLSPSSGSMTGGDPSTGGFSDGGS